MITVNILKQTNGDLEFNYSNRAFAFAIGSRKPWVLLRVVFLVYN